MKFLVVCLLALIVTSSAGKIFRSDFHSFDAEQNFPAEEAEADWGEEDWPSQPVQPHKQWHEPIVLKKRVPVYVPVPVEHVRTIVKHVPVYIKQKPSIIIRKVTHYNHH